MQLSVSQMSFAYEDAPSSALDALSATFPEGWTGIVGPNGSGKTTLLRILAGDLDGYHGSVTPRPRLSPEGPGTSLSYCAQTTEHLPQRAEDFALSYDSEALHIQRILGVEADWVWRFDTLSHGERKRLQVAVALWLDPQVLALDEPTNHVDALTRDAILSALKTYRGVGLLISHDRALLDALVQQCLFMRKGQGVMHSGTYTQGHQQELLEQTSISRERKAAKQDLAQLHGEQTRRAGEAARADSRRSKRAIDPKDHDAKRRIDLARVSGQDGKAGKLTAQMNTRVKHAEKRVSEAFVPKIYEGSFWLDTQPSKRRVIAVVPEGCLPLGADRSLKFSRLDIENTDHIGIAGSNGAGKSTFIRHLLLMIDQDIPTIYLPQELDSKQSKHVLADLKALDPASRGKVLSLVARLNSDPDRILSGETLSPGELRKILLAQGMLQSPQLVIMDEPTNHLDVQSIEALEAVLRDCPCALVLVSHDDPFLAAAASRFWRLSGDGNLTDER